MFFNVCIRTCISSRTLPVFFVNSTGDLENAYTMWVCVCVSVCEGVCKRYVCVHVCKCDLSQMCGYINHGQARAKEPKCVLYCPLSLSLCVCVCVSLCEPFFLPRRTKTLLPHSVSKISFNEPFLTFIMTIINLNLSELCICNNSLYGSTIK